MWSGGETWGALQTLGECKEKKKMRPDRLLLLREGREAGPEEKKKRVSSDGKKKMKSLPKSKKVGSTANKSYLVSVKWGEEKNTKSHVTVPLCGTTGTRKKSPAKSYRQKAKGNRGKKSPREGGR